MKIIAVLLLLTVAVKADLFLSIGEAIGDTYTGLCQGLQDDITASDTQCVAYCDKTYDYIVNAFDLTLYTNGVFSTTQFASLLQDANTYIQSSLNYCDQMTYILALNLRYVYLNYLLGSIAKVAVAVALDFSGDLV